MGGGNWGDYMGARARPTGAIIMGAAPPNPQNLKTFQVLIIKPHPLDSRRASAHRSSRAAGGHQLTVPAGKVNERSASGIENQRAYNVTRPAKSKRRRVKAIYHPPLSPSPPQGGFPCVPFAFSRLTPPLIKQDQAGATPS